MAESVDASVSNTDRETCAGSTPARSTRAIAPQSKIVERFFFVPFGSMRKALRRISWEMTERFLMWVAMSVWRASKNFDAREVSGKDGSRVFFALGGERFYAFERVG